MLLINPTQAEIDSIEGREPDCSCGLIACVCKEARKHKDWCHYYEALTASVGIACAHGYDVCPTCDPCTCGVKR